MTRHDGLHALHVNVPWRARCGCRSISGSTYLQLGGSVRPMEALAPSHASGERRPHIPQPALKRLVVADVHCEGQLLQGLISRRRGGIQTIAHDAQFQQ